MSARIIKQGMYDTIQDHGRYGYQHLGINPGGAMDLVAAAVANILAGNKAGAAVAELHFPASSFMFEKPGVIALSGADFGATINGEPVPLHTAICVGASSVLAFPQYKKGARCYLAVQGGCTADSWLKSYSTHTKAQAGGFHGRSFKKEDVLQFNKSHHLLCDLPSGSFVITPVTADVDAFYRTTDNIRCTEGTQYAWLDAASKDIFTSTKFTISPQSDRMGYRMEGKSLYTNMQQQLLSSAVSNGAVQLIPGGKLIVLMADHQTTGGYPVIAHVITADIPALAQMQPGAAVGFTFITIESAEAAYIAQQQNLLHLQDACNLQYRSFFSDNDFN